MGQVHFFHSKITSCKAATGGSIVSEILREFNGLGQMTKEWQEHAGAVNTSTSLKVQYTWSEMASGATATASNLL